MLRTENALMVPETSDTMDFFHSSHRRSTQCSDTVKLQGKETYPSFGQLPLQDCWSHLSCLKNCPLHCLSGSETDCPCPVCLQTPTFPVTTNCGHVFCAPCLTTYWKHSSWPGAMSCPLCRQKVSVLQRLFAEGRANGQEKEALQAIESYNRRFSGEPRYVTDYLYDTPLFLHLLIRGLSNVGGLVVLFLIRVTVCCFGAVFSATSPPQATPVCGLLGLADDLLVVFLLLTCVVSSRQQMRPQQASVEQGMFIEDL